MAELGEPGKGATSYALSPKGKLTESKSKVKPAPIEPSQPGPSKDKPKDYEKDQEKDENTALSRKGTKIGHRRIDEDGQITYKKQPSSALVSAIMLGIQYSVGRLSSKVERDVLMGDFYEIESVFFPSDGRQETPAHHYSDFRFKAYAPVAFKYFRELFHIAPDDFLISLCHEGLRELTNAGASGSLFYLSMDDQFIIKTVQHKEAEFLQKLLPGYYLNLNQNKRTLLPKFFGLYCYQCGGKNIRLVAMNNLLPSGYKIHLKYDLKGSTYKRKASKAERAKSSPTLKDLDFMNDHPDGISLDAETYGLLIKTIQRDCRVLESFKIMDYSLLLAIHNVDEAAREKRQARDEVSTTARTKATEAVSTTNNSNDRKASEKSTNDLAKGFHPGTAVARNPSARNRDDFSAYWEAIPQHRDDKDQPYGAIRARNAKGDRLLLFIGIIDILQSYRLKKRLEHGLKSVVQDGDSISVHRPSFYARRFQEFMAEKVFRKIPAKSQITRSPSKKRASFNTGRGRDRIRTSSDTDKQLHKTGEQNRTLGGKVTLSPSLDRGLANVVPGDVSFMGRETKSLEVVLNPNAATSTHDDNSRLSEAALKNMESNLANGNTLLTVSSEGETLETGDETETNGLTNKREDPPENLENSPNILENLACKDITHGDTSENEKLESLSQYEIEVDVLPSTSDESSRHPEDVPTKPEPVMVTNDTEVSQPGRADSFSDSEPAVSDSRI